MLLKYYCHVVFLIIIVFGIKQRNKLWKKTFYTNHQLSCFVGHPVYTKKTSNLWKLTSFDNKMMKTVYVISKSLKLSVLMTFQWLILQILQNFKKFLATGLTWSMRSCDSKMCTIYPNRFSSGKTNEGLIISSMF